MLLPCRPPAFTLTNRDDDATEDVSAQAPPSLTALALLLLLMLRSKTLAVLRLGTWSLLLLLLAAQLTDSPGGGGSVLWPDTSLARSPGWPDGGPDKLPGWPDTTAGDVNDVTDETSENSLGKLAASPDSGPDGVPGWPDDSRLDTLPPSAND